MTHGTFSAIVMNIMAFDFKTFQEHIEESHEWLRREYNQISAGRANPILLDSITIDVYGSMQPIKNVASIHVEDARTLRIVPWDTAQIQDIEKAISTSTMPLSTSVDGEGLRAQVPQVTEDNKKTLVKLIKDKFEDARVTVRRHRQDIDKEIESQDISDDEKRDTKDKMQKLVEQANKDLEEIFKKKETDIMSI